MPEVRVLAFRHLANLLTFPHVSANIFSSMFFPYSHFGDHIL